MVSKKVTLTNKTGLHARPASNLVAFVKKFQIIENTLAENVFLW